MLIKIKKIFMILGANFLMALLYMSLPTFALSHTFAASDSPVFTYTVITFISLVWDAGLLILPWLEVVGLAFAVMGVLFYLYRRVQRTT